MEGLTGLGVVVVIYIVFALWGIERRQSEIERRLCALSRHLGLVAEPGADPAAEPSAHVKALASDRSKYVEALRCYRQETGSDLMQAKRAIDPLRPGASGG